MSPLRSIACVVMLIVDGIYKGGMYDTLRGMASSQPLKTS
jgi:hypothetical protein